MSVSTTYLTIQRPQQKISEAQQPSKCFNVFMDYSWPNMLFFSRNEDQLQDPPSYAHTYFAFNSSDDVIFFQNSPQKSPPSYADTFDIFNTSESEIPSRLLEPLPTYAQALFFLKMSSKISQLTELSEKEIEERVISNLLNLIDKDTADL